MRSILQTALIIIFTGISLFCMYSLYKFREQERDTWICKEGVMVTYDLAAKTLTAEISFKADPNMTYQKLIEMYNKYNALMKDFNTVDNHRVNYALGH